MEFYKEGKVLGLTANTRLDLGSASLNHKGAMILCDAQCKLEYYTKGAVSAGVTFLCNAVNIDTMAFSNALIPVRLAAVTPAGGASATSRIILFN